MCLSLRVSPALTALCLAGVGFSQSSLLVDPPSDLFESSTSAEFFIGGRQIENAYPDLTIRKDGVDVTAQVGVSWSNETRVDINQDGWLESFQATATLDLASIVLSAESVIELEATTDGAAGPVSDRGAVRTLGHAEAGFAPSRLNVGALPPKLKVLLTQHGVPEFGTTHSLIIRKDGVDVTATTDAEEAMFSMTQRGGGIVDWRHDLEIDTASLGVIDSSTSIEVELQVHVPGAGTFSSSTGLGANSSVGQIPCGGDAMCAFIQSMGISVDANGDLSVGITDKDEMRAACEALRAELRACQGSNTASEDCFEAAVECEGMTIPVMLVIGGEASGPSVPTYSGGADKDKTLIVAIGGNATGTNQAGGAAEARGGEGSVAVAIGGTGSGTGMGGRSTSVASGVGSTGISLGGRGGAGGGQGGNGFTDCRGEEDGIGGQGVSGGGPGGHAGPQSKGGHGGGAGVRSNEGDLSRRDGGPKEGGAGSLGKHGSGACAQADSTGNASATRGHPVDN